MKTQNRAFFFRLPESLLRNFQKYCKENGSCASVELRRFMLSKVREGKDNVQKSNPA